MPGVRVERILVQKIESEKKKKESELLTKIFLKASTVSTTEADAEETECIHSTSNKPISPNINNVDTTESHGEQKDVRDLPRPSTSTGVYKDPSQWTINDDTIDYLLSREINQNCDEDLSTTKRTFGDKCRID